MPGPDLVACLADDWSPEPSDARIGAFAEALMNWVELQVALIPDAQAYDVVSIYLHGSVDPTCSLFVQTCRTRLGDLGYQELIGRTVIGRMTSLIQARSMRLTQDPHPHATVRALVSAVDELAREVPGTSDRQRSISEATAMLRQLTRYLDS